MNLRIPFVSSRSIVTALLLTCTAGKSVQALPNALSFSQQASIGNYAQLATAALTLPADLIATAHPDDNRLKLLNHGLKLINETLAVWEQHSPHSAAWACFDATQSAKALSALMATSTHPTPYVATEGRQPTKATNADDDLTVEDAAKVAATITDNGAPVDAQQWQKFVRYANYVLASAEATTRIMAALENNNPAFAALGESLGDKFRGSMAQRSEFKHGLTSLIRLARYCLQAPDKKQMAILLVLVVAEVATLFWQHQQTLHDKQPVAPTPGTTTGGVHAGHPTLILIQNARPFRDNNGAVIAARPPFNLALFNESLSLFAIDQNLHNNDFGQTIACETAFDQWCRNHNIAPFFNLQGMRPAAGDEEAIQLHNAFGAFWQQARQDADASHRPAFIRPLNEGERSTGYVLDFCRRFGNAYPQLNTGTTNATATVHSPNNHPTVRASDLATSRLQEDNKAPAAPTIRTRRLSHGANVTTHNNTTPSQRHGL
jgi:hypothetical protein